MRTFVFSDARSHKFWNIDLQGSDFTVSWGRVGTAGQSQTKSFASAEAARKEHDKLIREKTGKGYVETTAAAAPAAAPSSLRESLERAVMDDPSDLASHAAYADWLSEQTSPADVARAELMRIQLRQEDESISADERRKLHAREKSLVKKHQRDWAGPWVDRAIYDGPEGRGQLDFPEPRPVRYVRGLPAEVVVGLMTFRCAALFVTCPESRLVRKLFIGGVAYEFEDLGEDEEAAGAEPIPPALAHLRDVEMEDGVREALKTWPGLANLRAFQLGWTSNEEYGDFCHFQCHEGGDKVHELVSKMPRLEELYLFAHNVNLDVIFSLPRPDLRVLQVYHCDRYPLEKLAKNASLTKLTHLLFHPAAFRDEVSITLKGLKAVARSPHLKSLTNLRLRLTVFGDEGVREIIDSGLIGRLKTLDLRHGRVSDAGARMLAACPAVKNLELLDLSRNELTKEGIAALQATGVTLLSQHQHESTAEYGADPDDFDDLEFLNEGDYE